MPLNYVLQQSDENIVRLIRQISEKFVVVFVREPGQHWNQLFTFGNKARRLTSYRAADSRSSPVNFELHFDVDLNRDGPAVERSRLELVLFDRF